MKSRFRVYESYRRLSIVTFSLGIRSEHAGYNQACGRGVGGENFFEIQKSQNLQEITVGGGGGAAASLKNRP